MLKQLTLGCGEEDLDKGLLGVRQKFHHGLVERILVLLQPAGDVVRHLGVIQTTLRRTDPVKMFKL